MHANRSSPIFLLLKYNPSEGAEVNYMQRDLICQNTRQIQDLSTDFQSHRCYSERLCLIRPSTKEYTNAVCLKLLLLPWHVVRLQACKCSESCLWTIKAHLVCSAPRLPKFFLAFSLASLLFMLI